jgi:hypothetical protein
MGFGIAVSLRRLLLRSHVSPFISKLMGQVVDNSSL